MRGGGVAEGGHPEAGYTFHQDTGSAAVSLISDGNRHNPPDRLRQLITHILINATDWLDLQAYRAPSWLDRVSKKASVKADLGIYSHMLGSVRV